MCNGHFLYGCPLHINYIYMTNPHLPFITVKRYVPDGKIILTTPLSGCASAR